MTDFTFPEAMKVYLASLAVYEATDFANMDVDRENELSLAHWATADAVILAPAETAADLLEKISMIDARYMVDNEAIPDVEWEALKRDVAALARPTTPVDLEIMAAWERFAAGAWEQWGDLSSTEQSVFDERLLSTGIATHPRAAAAKLRYALYLKGMSPWLCAAALGADVPDMAAKIEMDDAVNEAIWSSIQSLETTGGSPDRTSWQKLVDTYDAALAAEVAFIQNHGGSSLTTEAVAEDTRLTDIRSDAEDAVMAFPSPDASAFAIKYLIAKGDRREMDCWNNLLEAEAKRFAGRA